MKTIICLLLGTGVLFVTSGCEEEHEHHDRHYGGAYEGTYHGYGHEQGPGYTDRGGYWDRSDDGRPH